MPAWLRCLFTPPLLVDPEANRRARLLHQLIIAFLIIVSAYTCLYLFIGRSLPYWGHGMALLACAFITALFGLVLLKWIDPRWVGLGWIGLNFLLINYWLWMYGTLRVPAVAALLTGVLVSGAIFEQRGAILYSFLASLSTLAIFLAETSGMVRPTFSATSITQWVVLVAALVLTTVIQGIQTSALKDALAKLQAVAVDLQRSNKALKDLQASLENLVLQRTAELSEEKVRFERIFNATPDLLCVLDINGTIQRFNPVFQHVLGFSPIELTGLNYLELIHPDDQQRLQFLNKETKLDENPVEVEVRVRSATGDYRWLAWHTSAVGEQIYLAARDITQQKNQQNRQQARQALTMTLAESNDLSQAAQEILPLLGVALDWQAGFFWIVDEADGSMRCLEAWGHPSTPAKSFAEERKNLQLSFGEDLPGRAQQRGQTVWLINLDEALLPEQSAGARQAGLVCAVAVPIRLEALTAGVIELYSTTTKSLDIELYDELTGIGSQAAQFLQRKRAEADLLRQKDELEALNQISVNMIRHLDLVGLLRDIVERAAFLAGTEHGFIYLLDDDAEMMELKCGIGLHADDKGVRVRGQGLVGRVWQSGEALVVGNYAGWEGAIAGYQDSAVSLILGVPLKLREQVIGVIGLSYISNQTAADIERVLPLLGRFSQTAAVAIENAQLYRSAQEARQAAEAANRAKSLFLANVSHELRTPLTVIIGYCEILIEMNRREGREPVVERLEKMLFASQHLQALINDILDISKIEANKLALNLQLISLQALVDDVTAAALPLAQSNHNRLVVHTPPDLGDIYADPMRLRQVLLNLLSNAAKFTHQGQISLLARREGHSQSNQDNNGESDWVIFEVRDTGIGIAADKLKTIFDPFEQSDASIVSRFGGTGLGLAISRRLCELMGGRLEVESELDEGSIFTVILPAAANQADRQ